MVELATVLMLVTTGALTPITSSSWLWFGLLLGASVIHLEAAQGIERIREVSAEGSPYTHMQSVWYFAGVLLLPLPLLALLIVLSFTHEWFRVFRGQAIAYRKVFSAATVVLAVGAGQLAFAAFFPGGGAPYAAQLDGPLGAVAVIVAGLAYRMVNYALVVGAIVASNPEQPARKALGHASDQLIIAASVGLGYAVGVFTVDRPWSMPILLVTVLALHMGLLLPQFRIAAHTDSKTGLVDAAWWSDRAADQLDRARRLARTVGVLMIDLDHFKEVNDCYGHLAGDQVLTAVAEAVRHSVRSLDLVGRWGGEEFAVLVPAVGVDELQAPPSACGRRPGPLRRHPRPRGPGRHRHRPHRLHRRRPLPRRRRRAQRPPPRRRRRPVPGQAPGPQPHRHGQPRHRRHPPRAHRLEAEPGWWAQPWTW
ncbi:diguanylate cyclase [Kutzneria sp. 744]|uniref:GGDEF domain-containing protein n=1 Tax=Kutzneria sp. (strain 744) TaxID=345341 RepID=UPI0003EECB05|nr:GGDEF domain-containing protein [Kutzneria sp. 744]EWM17272.1 GGDEF domain protein [Kutzneria sp. 744]